MKLLKRDVATAHKYHVTDTQEQYMPWKRNQIHREQDGQLAFLNEAVVQYEPGLHKYIGASVGTAAA